ncbi:MAG: filamentous hemagglutinin N-terminal domain-containing protein [Gammaproteobacteria bacterium]|nr:filamentous hemagglutinin N-terminal domain-containing protein [Gammaproteobacteria bacterium]
MLSHTAASTSSALSASHSLHPFKKRLISAAVQAVCYSMLLASSVQAGPSGGQVVGGTGAITQTGTNTTVNQTTQNMAINWQSYNVNSNERVQYVQPNTSSISLNRILSNNGSTIAGRIDANGQVILVNPNGVFFTATAVINVGGIIASGLDIKPSDFMNGNYIFNEVLGTPGTVSNAGLINASLGGLVPDRGNVALLGKQVENTGVIVANLGTVNLAAGKEAVLTFDNQGLLGVRVTKEVLQSDLGVDPAVLNSGSIQAEGGKVLLTASVSQNVFSQAVNTAGIQPATSVVVNADGTYTLGGGADVVNSGTVNVSTTSPDQNVGRIVLLGDNVTSRGTLQADAANGNGGEIELHSSTMTLLTQNSVTSARSQSQGTGGIVKVLGDKVGLFDHSTVDVSGANGGGQALIGGDYQGKNAAIKNASRTYVSAGSVIYADALEQGNGGKIIHWSNDYTWFYGQAFARGGNVSGNGGFVEISGKGLSFNGGVNTSAQNGRVGMMLFDPTDIVIHRGNGGQPQDGNLPSILAAAGGNNTFDISQGALEALSSTTDIKLEATNNITINTLGSTNGGVYTPATLALQTATGHSVTFTADADKSGAGRFSMNAADSIQTEGGSVTISGVRVTTGGINTTGVSGNQTGGNITVTTSTGNIRVGALTARGNVKLNSNTGDITIAANVMTNGGIFDAIGRVFDGSGVMIDTGTGTTGTATIKMSRDVLLGSMNVGGNLIVESGASSVNTNSIDQTVAGDVLSVTGSSSFTSLGNNRSINLANNNNLQGVITIKTTGTNTSDATLVNTAATTTLGAIDVKGAFTVNASQNLAVTNTPTPIASAANMALNFGTQGGGSYTFCYNTGAACANDTTTTGPTMTSTGGNLDIIGGSGTNTINLAGLTLTAPAGAVTVDGTAGTDTVIGQNVLSTWSITAPNTGILSNANGTVNFTGVESLTGGSGDDTFTVNSQNLAGPISIANINTGNGTNIVNVNATGAVTGTLTTGSGTNTVNVDGTVASIDGTVGNGANTIKVNAGGVVSGNISTGTGADSFNLTGAVNGVISGGVGTAQDNMTITAPGNVTVRLGNQRDAGANYTVDQVETITDTTLGSNNTLIAPDITSNIWIIGAATPTPNTVQYGVNTTAFSNFANVRGGSHAPTAATGFDEQFTVNSVTAPPSGANSVTTINTGTARASVKINAGASVAAITTGTGTNTLDVYGTVSGTGTAIDGTAGGANTIHVYAGGAVAGVTTTGAGTDNITVDAASAPSAAGVMGAINAGDGANTMTIAGTSGAITGGTTGTHSVTVTGQVNGAITLGTGGTGDGVETVNVTSTGKVSGGITTGSNNDSITVDGSALFIDAGAGNDQITIATPGAATLTGVSPSTTVAVAGGTGLDTLTVRTSNNTWSLDTTGTGGTVSNGAVPGITFSSVENFNNGGGTGSTLDYSHSTTAVVVDLNSFSGFSTLIGSNNAVTSTLIGKNATTNDWYIGVVPNTTNAGNNGLNDGTVIVSNTTPINFINFNHLVGGAAGATNHFYLTNATTPVPAALSGIVTALPTHGVFGGCTFSTSCGMEGGAGSTNTLTARDLPNDWTLDAAGSGHVSYTTAVGATPAATYATTFTGMQNLVGGADTDRFAFTAGAAVGSFSTMNGNGQLATGMDVVDFSLVPATTPVAVLLGSATYSGIEAFIGNGTTSTLTGAGGLPNTWNILDSVSITTAGTTAGVTANATTNYTNTNNSGSVVNGTVPTTFVNFANLTGGAGVTNTFDFSNVALNSSGGNITGTLTGGSAANTIIGRADNSTWTVNGLNSGFVIVAATGVRYVNAFTGIQTLIGGVGADNFIMGPSAGNGVTGTGSIGTIDGGVGAGLNTLTGADSTNTWSITGIDTGSVGVTNAATPYVSSFIHIQNLTGGAGADTFNFATATPGSITGLVDGGTGSNVLKGQNSPNTWALAATGNSVAITGNATPYVAHFTRIQQLLGGTSTDVLTITDPAVTTVQLGPVVNAAANLTVDQFETINANLATAATNQLIGATGANTWTITTPNTGTVNSTAFANFANLTGGASVTGSDTFDFSTTTAGAIGTITGGAGANTLKGRNTNSTWTITRPNEGSVRDDTGTPTIYITQFTRIQNLTGGSGADNFMIGATGSILGGATGISGGAVIAGNTATYNTLTGPDTASTWNMTGPDSGNLTTTAAAPGVYVNSFSSIQNLTGGAAADRFNFAGSTTGSIAGTLRGGSIAAGAPSFNTLLGRATANTWTINGTDAGFLDDTTTGSVNYVKVFSGIQNLTGGTGTDIFELTNVPVTAGAPTTGSLSGIIDGNTGANTLNVRLNDMTVQLNDTVAVVNNTATPTTIAVSAVQSIHGFGSHETLQGPNRTTQNTWTISAADSGAVNTVNFTGFGNLTGGTGTDRFTLTAGSLSGVIIGGSADTFTTSVSTNVQLYAALPVAPAAPIYNPPAANTVAVYGLGNVTATATTSTLLGPDGVSTTWLIAGNNSGSLGINNNPVVFTDFVNLKGGNGADNFVFGPYSNGSTINLAGTGSITGTIDGGIGAFNTLTGRDGANTWTISAANAGSLGTSATRNYVSAFSNIQNLTGGAGADSFVMTTGGSTSVPTAGAVDGVIDGGSIAAGTSSYNTLQGRNDNSTWIINATDSGNLAVSGGATYVNAFQSIQNLTGGSGGDDFTLTSATSIAGQTVGKVTGTIVGGGFIPGNVATYNTVHALFGRANTFGNLTSTVTNGVATFSGNLTSTDAAKTPASLTTDVNAFSGIQILDSTGSGVADFSGTQGPVSFQLGVSFLGVTQVIGNNSGTGQWDSTLIGYDGVLNTWTISGTNSGTVAYTPPTTGGKLTTVTFSRFNNLTGGNASNDFTMQTTGAITGTINGGSRSYVNPTASNTNTLALQWSPTATPSIAATTVDFRAPPAVNSGSAGYAYVANFNQITADAATTNANSVIGNSSDNTWLIDGANSTRLNAGVLNGTNLLYFGNLTGGTGADQFTLTGAGSLSGLISGGGHLAGQADSLTMDSTITAPMTVKLLGTSLPPGQVVNGSASTLTTYQIDTLTANSATANTLYAVDSAGSATGNTWNITGPNGGTVTDGINPNPVTFVHFATLFGGTHNDTFNVSGNSSILGPVIHSNGGTDALNVSLSGTETGVVNFISDGGSTSTVRIQDAATGNTGASTYLGTYTVGGATGNGTAYDQFAYSNGGSTFTVNFSGAQSIVDQVSAARLTVNGTSANDTMTLASSATLTNGAAITMNALTPVNVGGKQTLVLDGQGGSDTIHLNTNIALPASTLIFTAEQVTQTAGTSLNVGSLALTNVGAAGTSDTDRIHIATHNLSVTHSGNVYLAELDDVILGGITNHPFTTTGVFDLQAGGAISGTEGLTSNALFSLRTLGTISLTGNNALSGALTFTGPTPLTGTNAGAATVTLVNTAATTLAAVKAVNLDITSSGDIVGPANIVVSGTTTLASNGNIALNSATQANFATTPRSNDFNTVNVIRANNVTIDDINTLNGSITATNTTVLATAGISLTTATSTLDATNTAAGDINVTNTGTMQRLALDTLGNVTYTNAGGNIVLDHINTNFGGGYNRVNAPYGGSAASGNVVINGGSGSLTAYRTDFTNPPPYIVANTLQASVPQGTFGSPFSYISVRVQDAFYLSSLPHQAYVYFFDGVPPIRPGDINVFTGLDGINLQMIELESLGDVDPAIFTAVKNYYYEDIAIKMPEDQRYGDDEDNEKKRKRLNN